MSAADGLGYSVSKAGDVNGDGFDDLILGTTGNGLNGLGEYTGHAYVIFGPATPFGSSFDLSTLDGTNGFELRGAELGDRAGISVSDGGDANGDGFDDVIVGGSHPSPNGVNQAGSAYVVFGSDGQFPASMSLSELDGTNGFRLDGVGEEDRVGTTLAVAGDLNADGFDDLIFGAPQALGYGIGESYVVFGHRGAFTPSLTVNELDGENGFRIPGLDTGDALGFSASAAGDVNGDGIDDVILSAFTADPNGVSQAGESYVIFGRTTGFSESFDLNALDGSNGFRLDGSSVENSSGRSVASAGDVNGDGLDDLIIGAAGVDGAYVNTGRSYVLFGSSTPFSSTISLGSLDGTNGFHIDGIDEHDQAGRSVAGAGDVDGDGFDDLIIGAPGAGEREEGESYVVFGGDFANGQASQVGTPASDTLTASQGVDSVDLLIGGLGDDLVISDGGSDALGGSVGDDVLTVVGADFRRVDGGSGFDTLKLMATNGTIDLTTIPDNRIVDIEQIDLAGSGANELTLSVREVLRISSESNELIVRRDSSDHVRTGPDWTHVGDETRDGTTFHLLTSGAARLLIELQDDLYQTDLRIVAAATPLDANGESQALPADAIYLDEWDELFFLEVWGRTTSPIAGLHDVHVEIPFDSGLFAVTSVEFGAAFADASSSDVDVSQVESGRIVLDGTSDRPEIGEANFALIARVGMTLNPDRALTSTPAGAYVTPAFGESFNVENATANLDGGRATEETASGPLSVAVWPVMYDLDNNGAIGFGDVAQFAEVFGSSTTTNDDAFSRDFDRDGDVGFADVALFAQNFGRSRASGGQQSYAANFPDAWTPQALLVAIDSPARTASLEADSQAVPQETLRELQNAAVERFEEAGLSESELEALRSVDIRVQNLPDGYLGLATDDAIIIDVDASGLGWFIDATPWDDREFAMINQSGQGASAAAQSRVDLLTVITHELGHHAGLEHRDGGLMGTRLSRGERRLPDEALLFAAFSEFDQILQ